MVKAAQAAKASSNETAKKERLAVGKDAALGVLQPAQWKALSKKQRKQLLKVAVKMELAKTDDARAKVRRRCRLTSA